MIVVYFGSILIVRKHQYLSMREDLYEEIALTNLRLEFINTS